MKPYHIAAVLAVLAAIILGCGSSDTTGGTSSSSGGTVDNPNLTICERGAADGTKCLGFTESEKRGWSGFCVASVCTEYVPVKCEIASPSMTVIGCDGSGMVTGGMAIQFEHGGSASSCSGVQGEFGYCAAGDTCYVYQGSTLVGQGTCQ